MTRCNKCGLYYFLDKKDYDDGYCYRCGVKKDEKKDNNKTGPES